MKALAISFLKDKSDIVHSIRSTIQRMLMLCLLLQLKDFKTTDQSEATTEEVERVLQILRDLYQEIGEGKGKYQISRVGVCG